MEDGVFNRAEYWDNVFSTKKLQEQSWFEAEPSSLEIFEKFNVSLHASIIDVGCGDSLLVDALLARGYSHITALDVSAKALEKAQIRLGDKAVSIRWIAADVTTFSPPEKYDVWHDRAAFHFLTSLHDIKLYIQVLRKSIKPGSLVILSTFAKEAPDKCSGLAVNKYDEDVLVELLGAGFEKLECNTFIHQTPLHKEQAFLVCCFTPPES